MAEAAQLDFDNTEIAFRSRSTAELRRARLIFRAFGNPALAAAGPRLVGLALRLRLPVTPLVRWTVFDHFCGGVTLADTEARVRELARFRIRSVLDFSVEGLGREVDFERTAAEVGRVIARAARDPALPFAVFKVTGLARVDLLAKVATGGAGALTAAERAEWSQVEGRVAGLCRAAGEAGVRILIDAEESWIQPAIDGLALAAMRTENRRRAVVYNTFQMYRVGSLAAVGSLLAIAATEGFRAGVKIVRGAYMEKERARAAAHGEPSPIQPDKASVDRDFDAALARCIDTIDCCALFAGTHNEDSTRRLADRLVRRGLTRDDERIEFSQLLGMSDHLTYNLAHHGFNVCKYVPYGPVKAVIPYLIRRAAENSSIQGQAGRELQLIERELRRRRGVRSPGRLAAT